MVCPVSSFANQLFKYPDGNKLLKMYVLSHIYTLLLWSKNAVNQIYLHEK